MGVYIYFDIISHLHQKKRKPTPSNGISNFISSHYILFQNKDLYKQVYVLSGKSSKKLLKYMCELIWRRPTRKYLLRTLILCVQKSIL